MMQIIVPVTDLLRSPEGPRDRQLIYGDRLTQHETHSGYVRVTDETGYSGYIQAGTIGPIKSPTHIVGSRQTHAYTKPDFKSEDTAALMFNSRLTALSETESFIATELGFIPKQHVRKIDNHPQDMASAADVLLGTPYLWGGNSPLGIDCSGLIEAAQRATGQTVTARDSGDQERSLGTLMPPESTYKRNDLLFWRGHVALVVDHQTLIHANAHHMAVAYENIEAARSRISQNGDGEITAHKRL